MDHSIKKNSRVALPQARLHLRIMPMQKIKEHSRKVLLAMILVTYFILFYLASH